MRSGWTKIKGRYIMIENGRASWAIDENGEHVDIYRRVNDQEAPVRVSEGRLRQLMNEGKIIFR